MTTPSTPLLTHGESYSLPGAGGLTETDGMARRGKLTHEQQLFVVQELACFRTPSEVAAAVKEGFGVEISRQAAHGYSPEHNPGLPEKWRVIFVQERRRFLEDLASIAMSHRPCRLRELEAIYHRAWSMNNLPLALQVLEQAAKEAGGLFTNRRDLTTDLGDLQIIVQPDAPIESSRRT
jgi:hypothetical protein